MLGWVFGEELGLGLIWSRGRVLRSDFETKAGVWLRGGFHNEDRGRVSGHGSRSSFVVRVGVELWDEGQGWVSG